MAVVSDTTPLNYLVWIEVAHVVPALYGRVLIPREVLEELSHARTPDRVRGWSASPPAWLEVRPVHLPEDPLLARLESGESAAIVLAEQVTAQLLLIDERAGRQEARRRGLSVTGTLGVLERAAERDLLDFTDTVKRLRRTPFHMSEAVLRPFLQRDALRKQDGLRGKPLDPGPEADR